jgi:putative ABC transport system substrate-binding protein
MTKVSSQKSEVGKSTALGVLVALLFAISFHAEAQQPKKVPRIGFLIGTFPSANTARIDAFRQGLRELGYLEEKDIVIEYRWAE